LQKFDMNRFE